MSIGEIGAAAIRVAGKAAAWAVGVVVAVGVGVAVGVAVGQLGQGVWVGVGVLVGVGVGVGVGGISWVMARAETTGFPVPLAMANWILSWPSVTLTV